MASSSAAAVDTSPSVDDLWAQLDELDKQAVGEDLAEHCGPGVEARFNQLVRRHHRRASSKKEASTPPQVHTITRPRDRVDINSKDDVREEALMIYEGVSQEAHDDKAVGCKDASCQVNDQPAPPKEGPTSLGTDGHNQSTKPQHLQSPATPVFAIGSSISQLSLPTRGVGQVIRPDKDVQKASDDHDGYQGAFSSDFIKDPKLTADVEFRKYLATMAFSRADHPDSQSRSHRSHT